MDTVKKECSSSCQNCSRWPLRQDWRRVSAEVSFMPTPFPSTITTTDDPIDQRTELNATNPSTNSPLCIASDCDRFCRPLLHKVCMTLTRGLTGVSVTLRISASRQTDRRWTVSCYRRKTLPRCSSKAAGPFQRNIHEARSLR